MAQIPSVIPMLFTPVVEGMIRVNAQAVRRMFDTLGGAGLQGCLEEQCVIPLRTDFDDGQHGGGRDPHLLLALGPLEPLGKPMKWAT